MSSPSKSPAATCIIDPGFQIELDSQYVSEDCNSLCSCSCDCNAEQQQSNDEALAEESSVMSTAGIPHWGEPLQPVLRTEDTDHQHRQDTPVETPTQTATNTMTNYTTTAIRPKFLNCSGFEPFTAAFGVIALTICEFCPWLFGFIIVCYSYKNWGMSSAIGSFILMVIAHALLRYFRTQDKLEDTLKNKNHLRAESTSSVSSSEEVFAEVIENIPEIVISDENQNFDQEDLEIVVILPPEQPPSYESAVVKPPPYDLHRHLTPNASPSLSRKQYLSISKDMLDINLDGGTPLTSARTSIYSCEEDDDDSLPTYQDAMIASREELNFT